MITLSGLATALSTLILGVTLVAAFAPLDFWPLAILAPALLFWLWEKGGVSRQPMSPSRAFWHGYLFGLGFFGVGVSWVFNSIHEFGHSPAPFAAGLTLLFTLVLSVYPGLSGWVYARFARAWPRALAARLLWAAPAVWVLLEAFRGWFLTGFPWLWLGYSQIESPLAGVAPWLGALGSSWLALLCAALLANALLRRGPHSGAAVAGVALVMLAGWGAGLVRWTAPAGEPLRVALIQGNIQQGDKWSEDWLIPTIERYLHLTYDHMDADVIVWPEAALPGRYQAFKDNVLDPLQARLREQGVDVLMGILYRSERGTHNSLLKLGEDTQVYHKRHLVPFGEYIPLRDWLTWMDDMVVLPAADIAWGTEPVVLTAGGLPLAGSICYEDAYGAEMADMLPEATYLVNVSNDAWFGDSLAPWQHLQIARMRALELGRPMLRATNTGVSAIIDGHGRIVKRSPQFEIAVVRGEITPQQGATPFARLRHVPVLVLAALALAAGVWLARRRA